MKGLAVVALCALIVAVVWARPEEEKYEDFGKGVDIEEALNNERLRKNYFACFKTGDKCTTQARKVKDVIPEALTTGCKKCTDDQRKVSKRVLRFTIKNFPEEFKALEKVYDPDHKYRANFADELARDGIVLPD